MAGTGISPSIQSIGSPGGVPGFAGTMAATAASAIPRNRALKANSMCQLSVSMIAPPSTSPDAVPTPAAVVISPTAPGTRSLGRFSRITPIVSGVTAAASPWSARPASTSA